MTLQSKRRIQRDGNGWLVNNSSLELIQTCFRKANYTFYNPQIDTATAATTFGSAIHKALEVYYMASRKDRSAELMKSAFDSYAASASVQIPQEGEIRSTKSAHIILDAYHATYGDDTFEVLVDDKGPFVERTFEVLVTPQIKLFGQIDLVLKNTINGQLYVFDHKTTTALSGFADRVSPNHQLTGYIYAMQQLGHDCSAAVLQGIKVTKFARSSPEFVRAEAYRTKQDFLDWKDWVTFTTNSWSIAEENGVYPMNGSQSCRTYGGCRFKDVCAAPLEMRSDLLQMLSKQELTVIEE